MYHDKFDFCKNKPPEMSTLVRHHEEIYNHMRTYKSKNTEGKQMKMAKARLRNPRE